MDDRRTKNEKIFRHTERMYRTNEILKRTIKKSVESQKVILEKDTVKYESDALRKGEIIVSGKRTLEASESYAKQGKKVCILNFASATNPGGGVIVGSSAQEEAICRCSTLYPCLATGQLLKQFYGPHRRANDPMYNDDCVFTPSVKIFKSDISFPELLPEEEWWEVDVITCAAPNLRDIPSNRMNPNAGKKKVGITYEELRQLHRSRIQRIFEIAIANGAEVLILGAFGCGAFCNPPEVVAQVFAELSEKYRTCFDLIEYAVYHTKYEKANLEAFKDAMKRFE